jgi:hypothetical protein
MQGDPGLVENVVEPARVDPAIDQDRIILLENESDRVRLWCAIPADRGDPDDLFVVQPALDLLAERGAGVGERAVGHARQPW